MKIMSPLTFLFTNNLILQSLFLTLSLSLLKIPILFLQGLHTYIHPDEVNPSAAPNGGLRAAIRRPGTSDHQELKPENNPKKNLNSTKTKLRSSDSSSHHLN
ncbi:hypothetical protein CsSME_00038304 [Camellia sinensis var. sinensis]